LSADLMAPGALPDIVQGSADARATVIEYASMTCSHCAAFHHAVWPALKAKYVDSGKVKFILREFPLDPLAAGAFMLARCAGPEKRDAVVDRLFERQAEWAFAANSLFKLKAQVLEAGLSTAEFEKCLANQDLFDHIKQAREMAATRLEVRSTPTFFVNGVRLTGEPSLESFDEVLAPALR
jgi:protein-disulfide isomerase